jgi:dUTP pyrophosphatase
VHLVNLSDKTYSFEKGDKVAQLVILPVAQAKLVEVETLSDSSRGTGQFGSTGKK